MIDQRVLKMERRAKELFVGKVDKFMWGSEVDYKIGESSLADRCISYHDKVVEAQRDAYGVLSNRAKGHGETSLESAVKRARDYLALCNADDGKVEKLIENLQSIVDGQCKMRDSDFCVVVWMSVLGLLVSYFGVLMRVVAHDSVGQIMYIFIFGGVLAVFVAMPIVRRRREWNRAFSEGNIHKIKEVISDLAIYQLTDSRRLLLPVSRVHKVQRPDC